MARSINSTTKATLATSVSSKTVACAGVVCKSGDNVESMRVAGNVAARAVDASFDICIEGATTSSIAEAAGRVIEAAGGEAIFRGYRLDGAPPFGAAACVCVNDEIVHGLPGDRTLVYGDVVSVDVGVRVDGWCADTARSMVVSSNDEDGRADRLVHAGRESLEAILDRIRPGVRWSEVSEAGDKVARDAGLLTLRGWAGHGIGRDLHEAPALPMRPRASRGEDLVLEAGMTLAIEPILALSPTSVDPAAYADGSSLFRSAVCGDGWTVVSIDGWLTCHFEHTIAVTNRGVDVLTAA